MSNVIWTESELQYLVRMYKYLNTVKLATLLPGKTVLDIRKKARELKITKAKKLSGAQNAISENIKYNRVDNVIEDFPELHPQDAIKVAIFGEI